MALELRALWQRAGSPSSRFLGATAGGISHTTVAQALSGKRVPSWAVLRSIVHALGGSEDHFRPLWVAASTRPMTRQISEADSVSWIEEMVELQKQQLQEMVDLDHLHALERIRLYRKYNQHPLPADLRLTKLRARLLNSRKPNDPEE
jgi:transcriptional regulator with XRE-family HTH domain